jgi:hypothetical protein
VSLEAHSELSITIHLPAFEFAPRPDPDVRILLAIASSSFLILVINTLALGYPDNYLAHRCLILILQHVTCLGAYISRPKD